MLYTNPQNGSPIFGIENANWIGSVIDVAIHFYKADFWKGVVIGKD
ncbi:hypothetical protein [Pseudanabaena sp. BC1403]|nr:hypothetical protein [Pseudanabaena sp. BC1403]